MGVTAHFVRAFSAACLLVWPTAPALTQGTNYPTPEEGDWVVRDFRFHTGVILPELRLHYTTIGVPTGEPVLILHGTGSNGRRFLTESFAGEMFGPGQPLDARRYFIVLPDSIGHGLSSKPSDGMKGRFPEYTYEDMVRAQYRLVTEHLGIRRLRLIIGGSMGGMHAWMWGVMYPEVAAALMPLQCLPVEIAGMNRMLRRVIIDSIRSDPEWQNGNYERQPARGLTGAEYGRLALFGSPSLIYTGAPTRALADAQFDQRVKQGIAASDANDLLYSFEASRDYNPEPLLGAVSARVLAINTADDSVNPPELDVMPRVIARVKNGKFLLIPRTRDSAGHGSYVIGKLYAEHVRTLLGESQPNGR